MIIIGWEILLYLFYDDKQKSNFKNLVYLLFIYEICSDTCRYHQIYFGKISKQSIYFLLMLVPLNMTPMLYIQQIKFHS